MKALCLTTPDGKSVNAVDSTIVISNKEGNLRLTFGGCDKEKDRSCHERIELYAQ